MTDFAGGLKFFPNVVLRAGKKASGELMGGAAGTVRWLHEYVNGILVPNSDGKVAPGVPANSLLPGHDHSGGLMGVPHKSTIWSMPYGRYTGANTGTDTNHDGPNAYLSDTTGRAAIEYVPTTGWARNTLFVPPGKAFELLTPEFLLYAVDFDIDVTCSILAPNGTEYTKTGTITNNTENQFFTFTSKSVPFFPGVLQQFGWRVMFNNSGGGGNPDVTVLSVAIHQDDDTP